MFVDWLTSSGLAILKPVLAAFVLPPTPFIVLALLGAWLAKRQRRGGMTLATCACIALWLGMCDGSGWWLQRTLLHPPAVLSAPARSDLAAREARGERIAIVVLGGGVERDAHEYGGDGSSLGWASLERLRYGLWLGRATGIPVGMSGGAGWGMAAGTPVAEASVAGRIAASEFGQPLRWQEATSRDTHENAVHSIALLQPEGIRRIVLVTHDWHTPRALREFRAAAAAASASAPIEIDPAPIGSSAPSMLPLLEWLPSFEGVLRVRLVLRESLGLLFAH